MSKLLTEPRLIKEITEKPKKKRYQKTPDGETLKYTLIHEGNKRDVEELIRVYKENPLKARVKYYNKGSEYFRFSRLALFEFENGDFEFSCFNTKFGISTTNRVYSNQSKIASISYKKGKFWVRHPNKTIAPLTWASFINFIGSYEGISTYNKEKVETSKVFQYFTKKFYWVRMLSECEISWAVTFNTVKDKKLDGLKDVYRYVMKVPAPIAKIVIDSEALSHLKGMNSTTRAIGKWKEILKVLTNIDHLTPELIGNQLFADTCIMAQTLDRKINCKWGSKRLKDEHDRWALEITNTVLDCEIEYDLNIRPIYKAFADFSGYRLLSTNKDMLREGMLQHHCVGTYINRVETGECAIFHIDGYTLQLGVRTFNSSLLNITTRANEDFCGLLPKNWLHELNPNHSQILTNLQFKGRYNDDAPQELIDRVSSIIVAFVNADGFENTDKGESTYRAKEETAEAWADFIPF